MEAQPNTPAEKDSPICLFLGAGASVGAGVPTTVQFVERIKAGLQGDAESTHLYRALLDTLGRTQSSSDGGPPPIDVERILEAISLLSTPPQTVTSLFGPPSIGSPVDLPKLEALQVAIRRIVRRECIVEADKTQYLIPLVRLFQTYGPLDIFTTNYDVVIDQFATWSGMRVVDGLGMEWNPGVFQKRSEANAFLYRLHGAVTWYRSSAFGFLKLPVREGNESLVFLSGEKAEAMLLYPAQKDLLYSPFVHGLSALHTKLRSSPWWVVVGYSFRDEQLLGAFQEAATDNPDLRMILLSPDAEGVFRETLERQSSAGGPSPFDRKLYANRVLRLPYNFETSFDDVVSAVLPKFMETVQLESQYRLHEVWRGKTDWPAVALGYASIGLLDPLQDFERQKLAALKPRFDWLIQYHGFKALNEAANGDVTAANGDWAEVGRALDKLRSWRPAFEAFGQPPFNVRPAFGFLELTLIQNPPERMVSYGYPPDSVANLLEEMLKVADRLGRCCADPQASRITMGVAGRLKELIDYLRMFSMNGMMVPDYVELRRTVNPELVGRLSELASQPAPPPGERLERVRAIFEEIESPIVSAFFDRLRRLEPTSPP